MMNVVHASVTMNREMLEEAARIMLELHTDAMSVTAEEVCNIDADLQEGEEVMRDVRQALLVAAAACEIVANAMRKKEADTACPN